MAGWSAREQRGEVDGVPVLWAEAPEPFAAGLIFRTGRADETLPTAGITHLVEHLVLPAETIRGCDFNGMVDATETSVFGVGERDAVLRLIERTVAAAARLPLERLEAERNILLTEAGQTPGLNLLGHTLALRYGPVGAGLVGYDEFGLHRVTGDEVSAWAADRFAAANVIAWMTGEPPPEWSLALPRGERRIPPPEPRPIPYVEYPSVFMRGATGGVTASFVGRRSFELRGVVDALERRLRHLLRFRHGISYAVTCTYIPLTAEQAHITVSADCLDTNAARVRDEMLAVLDELATGGPGEEELAHDIEDLVRQLRDPASAAGFLGGAAATELVTGTPEPIATLVPGRESVTSAGAAAALADALPSLLLLVPPGTRAGADRSRFTEYPYDSPRRVHGRRFRPRGLSIGEARRRELVIGDEGITFSDGAGVSTVLWDELVGALGWVDDTRGVWSADGYYVEVNPQHWRRGRAAVAEVERRIPPELLVPMDTELRERIDAVGVAIEGKLKRGWMTGQELDNLPHVLERGEQLEAVAAASRGVRAGLLAVTDRRVLFLYLDEVELDVGRADVRDARSDAGGWLSDNRLVVETAQGEQTFTDIKPDERVDEFLALLRPQRD